MAETPTLPGGLSKLLAPADEDVKAIRSFLPGKLLGRTAVVLAIVLGVFWYITPLHEALEKFVGFSLQPVWLWNSLLLGIPVLIAIAQVAAEWAAERKRKQAQALAVKVDAVPEGYFRIGPYLDSGEDRAKFDRADRAHEKVLAWPKRADATPLYLTGDSGAGKSSVLNAYALPELREAGWTIVEARAWQDPEAALTEAIGKLAEAKKWRLGEAKSLRARLGALVKRADASVLLVLDQFEEFFILAGSERQKAFTAIIHDLRAKPIKGLKLLLVLRSDYTTAIDELGLPLLRQGENWQEIGRFTTAAGVKFMARSGLALEPSALDRLATSASELDDSPGMIRPITLNVVGQVLSQGRASAPSLDAGQLVRHYIEQSVEQPAIREFAPRVLTELVTEQGTKRPRSERELVDQTGLRPGEVRAVMNGLWTAALARPLDAAQGAWELSHDFVARAVARYLGRRRLDWPGLTRAFAAPALFGLMAAAVAGAIIWNANAADRARAQLADLGIDVSSSGFDAAASPRPNSMTWEWARPLVSRLTALQSLNLSNHWISDIEPLRIMTALQTLDLSETQVANVDPLTSLTALQTLNLSKTKVADVEPLKGLTALHTLDLSQTQVANVEPLRRLTALHRLDLSGTPVADIESLKGLTALTTLSLLYTHVANVEPLKGLTALQTLFLSGTPLADLEPLKGLTALQWLNISDTQVADIEPLKDLTALTALELRGTHVANVEPLKGITALQALDLSQTQVASVEPLKIMTALKSLYLSGTPVADLTPVRDLPRLETIFGIGDTELQKLNAYRAQNNLPLIENSLR